MAQGTKTEEGQRQELRTAEEFTGGPEMTLIEHLIELRRRVIISALAVVVGIVICAVFWEDILGWLLAPARERNPDFQVSSFSPTDRIAILFRIALYGGLLVASPVVVYEILAFVVPGLTPRERRLVLPVLFGSAFFLLGGMAFAYWVILPASLGFLLDFGSENIRNVIGIRQYVDFVTRIVFWVGVSFELPMLMMFLSRLGVVTAGKMLGLWRYALVAVFVVAAVVTPTPDPLTQSLVAGPLFVLYFVGVVLAWMARPRTREEDFGI
ncbi:Sec-independent protein translocase protein TatC [bacterium HR29]|jgi:sec-independent protein translocase protein TatC|nr:Sec-independent protein translocase protein TatC [bacterium HR29]